MKRSFVHFLVLLVILTSGVVTFLSVRPNTALQLFIGIVTAISYVLWGIIHHVMQKDLHRKIVIEYLLIGAIAIVLLVTMLGF